MTSIKKVIVGMSGGVDSSVSAWLLKKQGYHVEGLFMKNWEDDDTPSNCNSTSDLSDVRAVCETLKIQLHTMNFSKEYWDHVFTKFLKEYKNGHTPNPDVLCNKKIKFKYFLKFAIEDLQANFIATGHYVRLLHNKKTIYLMRGCDLNKDQSYFLHTLSDTQLKYCLFPIGTFTKPQVRSIAKQLNLITANKKSSTGICFIGKRKFKNFLSNYIPIHPGIIIDLNGNIIGKHQGISFYTIGQRQGLNIGGIKQGSQKPWYVVEKNITKNILIAVQGKDHPCLLSTEFIANNIHWISKYYSLTLLPFCCTVKTRYRQEDIPCRIYPIANNSLRIILNSPISAITPGQSAVFYHKQHCLGGGTITKRHPLQAINTDKN